MSAPAFGADIPFTASFSGANERPTPNASPATGLATATLSGSPGAWVFTYHIEYSGLTGTSVNGAHIHLGETPVGAIPTEQSGGVKHGLDAQPMPVPSGVIDGDWRSTDATQTLTDAFAQDLVDGKMYFNIHTLPSFAGGEIRGQIIAVPEPAAFGVAALGALGLLARRRRA
jgi:hypothetical protein